MLMTIIKCGFLPLCVYNVFPIYCPAGASISQGLVACKEVIPNRDDTEKTEVYFFSHQSKWPIKSRK